MTNKGTRLFLAVVAALAVLYFGNDGRGGEGLTSAIVVLALAAAAVTYYLTGSQNSTAAK